MFFTFVRSFTLWLILSKITFLIFLALDFEINVQTKVNQWHNTSNAIECFPNCNNKEPLSFMVFDIEILYPSVSKNIFIKAMRFDKQVNEMMMKILI